MRVTSVSCSTMNDTRQWPHIANDNAILTKNNGDMVLCNTLWIVGATTTLWRRRIFIATWALTAQPITFRLLDQPTNQVSSRSASSLCQAISVLTRSKQVAKYLCYGDTHNKQQINITKSLSQFPVNINNFRSTLPSSLTYIRRVDLYPSWLLALAYVLKVKWHWLVIRLIS